MWGTEGGPTPSELAPTPATFGPSAVSPTSLKAEHAFTVSERKVQPMGVGGSAALPAHKAPVALKVVLTDEPR
jgi:hypothetical protein